MAHPGLRTSLSMLVAQMISVLGSSLTSFALGIWVYQTQGSVTNFALILLFATLPGVLISPFAGTLIDRKNRRLIIIASDSAAGLLTLMLLVLLSSGHLGLWHIYAFAALSACCNAFQVPAYIVEVTAITPRRHLGRVNGLMQAGQAVAQIGAPLLASIMVNQFGLHSVFAIDLTSCVAAIGVMALLRRAPASAAPAAHGSFWQDVKGGVEYLLSQPALLGLLGFMAMLNFIAGSVEAIFTPLVLSFGSVQTLGVLSSVGGLGLLAGSLLIGVWGGPRRRLPSMLVATAATGAVLLMGGLRPTPLLVGAAIFVYLFNVPIIETCNVSIWQHKVPPHLHGRVFALRRSIAWISLPLAYGIAGPLADRMFRPWLLPGGRLADTVGQVIGIGEGRGYALFLMALGALTLTLTVSGALYTPLREIETRLPDMLPEQTESGADRSGSVGHQGEESEILDAAALERQMM